MGKTCAIKGCKSESYPGCGVSFFKLPGEESRRKKWLDVIPSHSTIKKSSVICSLHFRPQDIIKHSSVSKLKTDAVPTIFPKQSLTPAKQCIDIEELIKTAGEKKAMLDKINSRRDKVAAGELRSYPAANNMLKLTWNTELEQSAQRWANQCVKDSAPDIKDACRDLEGVSVGQNIATVYGESPGLVATALVDVWYMELLNSNGSILHRFRESRTAGPQYEYFTQLVWAESSEVGCGGVQYKERLQDQGGGKNRTVYRLVCNFAPSGNRENQSVYTLGIPCSKCPNGTACDTVYSHLCRKVINHDGFINKTEDIFNLQQKTKTGDILSLENSDTTQAEEVKITNFEKESDLENYTLFDYFSHLHEYTRQAITVTSTPMPECKDVLAVDEFIQLLKKKLSNDHIFKELLLASKTTQGFPETNFTDASVAAFVNKIYSKKEPLITTKSTDSELLNSTLLVDLVEAVIFRSGDRTPARVVQEQSTIFMSDVNPIKIQAELAQIPENEDFTGHYFFPEDEESNTTETTEYYDGTSPYVADVLMEIEDIKKNAITKNFLDDILESESADSSRETATTIIFLSPDNMNPHKSGHEVMKKFLEDIKEKSD